MFFYFQYTFRDDISSHDLNQVGIDSWLEVMRYYGFEM